MVDSVAPSQGSLAGKCDQLLPELPRWQQRTPSCQVDGRTDVAGPRATRAGSEPPPCPCPAGGTRLVVTGRGFPDHTTLPDGAPSAGAVAPSRRRRLLQAGDANLGTVDPMGMSMPGSGLAGTSSNTLVVAVGPQRTPCVVLASNHTHISCKTAAQPGGGGGGGADMSGFGGVFPGMRGVAYEFFNRQAGRRSLAPAGRRGVRQEGGGGGQLS